MDKQAITILLEQNLETIKMVLEIMFTDVKKEITALRQENTELKSSLQFTQAELDDLKGTTKSHGEQLQKVSQGLRDNEELEERVRIMDDNFRRNNIRIEGVPEGNSENFEQTQVRVESVIAEKLKVNVKIESANRVGSNIGSTKPRPIIARFPNFGERQKCMKAAPKLKGSNIYFNEDVCKKTMEKRKPKIEEMKMKRKQGFIAYFSGDRLIVRKRNEVNLSPVNIRSRPADNTTNLERQTPSTPVGASGGVGYSTAMMAGEADNQDRAKSTRPNLRPGNKTRVTNAK